jgi:hypothetical protein
MIDYVEGVDEEDEWRWSTALSRFDQYVMLEDAMIDLLSFHRKGCIR